MKRSTVSAWKQLFDNKADEAMYRYALTGDGSSASTADVSGRPGWAWIRYDEKADRASQVMNYRYPGIAQDVPVVIGKQYPTDRFYQILGLNIELYYQSMPSGSYPSYLLPIHGTTHTGDTGNDPVPVVTGNIVHGRVRATEPVSLVVFAETMHYVYNGAIAFWTGGTITMSGHEPAGPDEHAYILISIDATDNTLTATDGTAVPLTVSPTIPDIPADHIPLAAILLADDSTTVTYGMIYDYRMLFEVVKAPGDVQAIRTVTADYTAVATDEIILVDATGGDVDITLPDANGIEGQVYTVQRQDNSANTVTVQGTGGDNINDQATQTLSQYDAIKVVSDDTEWWVI